MSITLNNSVYYVNNIELNQLVSITNPITSLSTKETQRRSSINTSLDYEIPLSSEWKFHHFSNLRYLAHYNEKSTPLPLDICYDLSKCNEELRSGKYTNLALVAKVSNVVIAGIVTNTVEDTTTAVWLIVAWSSLAEYVANRFEKTHSIQYDAADKNKDELRKKVSKRYHEMAEELIEQYCASPEKALKITRRNRRNSVLDAQQQNKIKCFKISEALLGGKLEAIKTDLIARKFYNIHFDNKIESLNKKWSMTKLFKSQMEIETELQKMIKKRDADIDEVLKPLEEAAKVIHTLFTDEVQDQHEGSHDIRFEGNEMFKYYLKSEHLVSPASTPEMRPSPLIPHLNMPVEKNMTKLSNHEDSFSNRQESNHSSDQAPEDVMISVNHPDCSTTDGSEENV